MEKKKGHFRGRNGGAPTKINEEVVKVLVDASRTGLMKKEAARLANISLKTLHTWLHLGKDGDERYVDFYRDYKRADSERIDSCLRTIKEASVKTWQAAAWILERRNPEKFSPNARLYKEVNFIKSLLEEKEK